MADCARMSDVGSAGEQCYLIALGSNIRHVVFGPPRSVVSHAIERLADIGTVVETSPIIGTAPLGPSKRRYANAAILLKADLQPLALLHVLKRLEREFGERRGQRWHARVLDLDIILWSGGQWSGGLWNGGIWTDRTLAVPHPDFRKRPFVLGPAAAIAPGWRDPVTALSLRQLNARLTKPRPAPR